MIIIMAKSFAEASAVANSMGIPKMLWRPVGLSSFTGMKDLTVIIADGWKHVPDHVRYGTERLLENAIQLGRVSWVFREESTRPR